MPDADTATLLIHCPDRPGLVHDVTGFIFSHLGNIIDLQIARIADRLRRKRLAVKVTDKAKKLLAKKGYDPVFGARPLKRTLQREILDPLALKIIEGEAKDDMTVTVDAKGEAVTVKVG